MLCNADWVGFFTTKGTKVFEVLLIEIIDTIKRYFGGFLLWFVWVYFVPRNDNFVRKFHRNFASIQYHSYLAPIEVEILALR